MCAGAQILATLDIQNQGGHGAPHPVDPTVRSQPAKSTGTLWTAHVRGASLVGSEHPCRRRGHGLRLALWEAAHGIAMSQLQDAGGSKLKF